MFSMSFTVPSSFSVTKYERSLVRPSQPTPSGKLPLSPIDRRPGFGVMLEALFVYEKGQEPAKTIKGALSQALVPYYPFAGRLVDSDHEELQVACTAQGVWFVEAFANCSLMDVGHLQDFPFISKEQFLPSPRPSIDPVDPLFMIQVTEFTCGGFTLGIIYNHAMADGIGLTQFLKSIAEIARNDGKDSRLEPIWCREGIPDPQPPAAATKHSYTPPTKLSMDYLTLDVSSAFINKVRSQFMEQTGQECTMFDVVVAKVWQSRSRARAVDAGGGDLNLVCAANLRHLWRKSSLIPKGGYYGNCVYPLIITAPSSQIQGASVVEIVKLIQDSKQMLPTKFKSWVRGEGTFDINIGDESLVVSDWSRLGEVDYGWGKPMYVGPCMLSEYLAIFVIVKPPAATPGARLRLRCVRKDHFQAFQNQMMDAL